MIIAIDGPAGAGKGTLGRRLAEHLGFAYLDTGALYRATALKVLRAGLSPDDGAGAARMAAALTPPDLCDPELRAGFVGEAASRVAALPAVRKALLEFQKRFAHSPPEGAGGAVLDGRDIGTVVCPEADVKLFVTADLEERARRRWRELIAAGDTVEHAAVRADLAARDARDVSRAHAPLGRAPDAHLLDTTDLDIEAAFAAALALVDGHRR